MADSYARLAPVSTRYKLLVALVLGILVGLGQAPWGLWWLSLIALSIVAVLLESVRGSAQAFWTGWAFGIGYFGLVLSWIVEPFLVDIGRHGWMAPFGLIGIAAGMGLFWAAALGLARALGGVRHAPLVAAVTLTAAEMVRTYIFTGFPWGMIAYVWSGLGPMQFVSWVGPHGLNLFTYLITFGTFWLTQLDRRFAGPAAIVLWGGFVGLSVAITPPPSKILDHRPVVRLLQPNAAQHLKWREDMVPVFFQRQLDFSGFGGNPDLVVWPETAVPSLLTRADNILNQISAAANNVVVVVGIQRQSETGFHNSLAVISPNGTANQVYDKHHLVPFGEYVPLGSFADSIGLSGFAAQNGHGYVPGDGPKLLDFGSLGRALPLICYEAIFPQDAAGSSERPDWLLQITNDAWFGTKSGPYQHLVQAQFRAAEQGLPLLRAANTGITAAIDPYGRVRASIPLGEAGYLDAPLPEARPATIYAKSGDSPLALLIVMLLCGSLAASRRFRN